MILEELKNEIQKFRKQVIEFKELLLVSSTRYRIITNQKEIDDMRASLNRTYATLERYIKSLGKNPAMSDGVWNVIYPAYDNAFSPDTLVRVIPSLDRVLQDLDYIIGRLSVMMEEEFQKVIMPPEEKQETLYKTTTNYWNYVNPFWLIWRLIVLMWKHKIISGIISVIILIITGLIIAYLTHKFGWNK